MTLGNIFIPLATLRLHKPSPFSHITLLFFPVHCSFLHLNAVNLYGHFSDHYFNVTAFTAGPLLVWEQDCTVTVCRMLGEDEGF